MCTHSVTNEYVFRCLFVVRPKFKVKPANTTAYEGHSTMLHCIATGDPEPAVQWDKNNKILVIEEHQNRLKVIETAA
jgi:Immunoglobulin domain